MMDSQIDLEKIVKKIPISKYDNFCTQFKKEISNKCNLDIFKDKFTREAATRISKDLFAEEIESILSLLNDNNIAISAIDLPESSILDEATRSVFGVAIVLGIFNNIGKSNIDPVNNVPFTLHTAYHSNIQKLESAGLDVYKPEVKLGFHNDGLLSPGKVEIPKHIMVYNLYISYRRPGNFIWVPTALWDEADKYGKEAKSENIFVKVKLTPQYFLNKDGGIIDPGFNYVETPVSSVNQNDERRFFLNGRVLVDDNPEQYVDFVQAIRDSLENNFIKIAIPQKAHRAFFLKNTMGFHARDIFQDPIENVDLSRVLVRSVDINSEIYPSRQ